MLRMPKRIWGPLKYADWLGLQRVVERRNAYARLDRCMRPPSGCVPWAEPVSAITREISGHE